MRMQRGDRLTDDAEYLRGVGSESQGEPLEVIAGDAAHVFLFREWISSTGWRRSCEGMITPGVWQKSSFSGGGQGDACVEVAYRTPHVAVRDSKVPAHGTLTFRAPVFAAFLAAFRPRE
ncbi:DUF397 domain-containing protein [Streptomyces sp. NPDC023723]|uniref:DUF397 domain-containing protein n=1 Tax=Streptomyces sp. NPDC023723 TaxID=3154323 RepID=UPI0033DAE630